MTFPSLERVADDVLMATVIAVVMFELGAIAFDAQITPWSEPLSCSMAAWRRVWRESPTLLQSDV